MWRRSKFENRATALPVVEIATSRIHRWLIHHVLSSAGFNPPNVVFPISAAILRDIVPYKREV
jgi:hypothetical protein